MTGQTRTFADNVPRCPRTDTDTLYKSVRLSGTLSRQPMGAEKRGPHASALALPLCSSCPPGTVTAFFRLRLTGYIMSYNNILRYKGRSFITPLITGGV